MIARHSIKASLISNSIYNHAVLCSSINLFRVSSITILKFSVTDAIISIIHTELWYHINKLYTIKERKDE